MYNCDTRFIDHRDAFAFDRKTPEQVEYPVVGNRLQALCLQHGCTVRRNVFGPSDPFGIHKLSEQQLRAEVAQNPNPVATAKLERYVALFQTQEATQDLHLPEACERALQAPPLPSDLITPSYFPRQEELFSIIENLVQHRVLDVFGLRRNCKAITETLRELQARGYDPRDPDTVLLAITGLTSALGRARRTPGQSAKSGYGKGG